MQDKLLITLTDDNGNDKNYQILDINYIDDELYTVVMEDVPDNQSVMILRVENPDKETSEYFFETDERIVNEVFKQFKQKYNLE